MAVKVEHNISRLNYLLQLYRLTVSDFIDLISGKRKNRIKEEEIFSPEISISHLKKIDNLFNKGINYYLDPNDPPRKEASIFFRKSRFETELNIGAKKVVNQTEDSKNLFTGIAKLTEINIDRKLPGYRTNQNARMVARELREVIYPGFHPIQKDFLTELISRLADFNVLVIELVEHHALIDKANIDGFYLAPNVILVKRHKHSFRREIFTLIHEFGHYLLKEEEIEKLEYERIANRNISHVERWCNDFAYYFLIGEFESAISNISAVTSEDDYFHSHIEDISNRTHLSREALYTRLLFERKVAPNIYRKIIDGFNKEYEALEAEREALKALKKERGEKQFSRPPKPILSPLLTSTYRTAYFEGIISEYELRKTLKIPPSDNLNKFLD